MDLYGGSSIANALISVIGLGTAHRPYQPATPMGSSGTYLGLEITLVNIPPAFTESLESIGFGSASALPVLPVPKFHLSKGLGNVMDFEFSGLGYTGFIIAGGSLKWTFYNPKEEGICWAIRYSYTYTKLGFIRAKTHGPEILISRKMEFADPYIGLGYRATSGTITIPIEIPTADPSIDVNIPSFDPTLKGSGKTYVAFIGVGMELYPIKLTMGGEYNSYGSSSLGIKLGFTF